MRKLALLATAAIFCVGIYAPATHAQLAVVCPNCAQIIGQAQALAVQVEQKVTEIASLQTQLNSYAQMVRSGLTLPQSIWANVQGDIYQVRDIANAASLLTGQSGSILSRLQSAQGYANQAAFLPQNMAAQFTYWQQTIGNAGNSLGRTLGVQQGQEQSYTAFQAAIQAHSQTAAGQTQAIQAGNESLDLVNTQLQQVHTTLVAAAQEQATRTIVDADRTAVNDAAMKQFSQYTPMPTTGSRSFP